MKQRSLSSKLLAGYAAVVVVCLSLVGLPLHRVVRRDYVSRGAALFEQGVQGIEPQLRAALTSGDQRLLDSLCERLNTGFNGRVSVIGATGKVLADSISARCAALARPECIEQVRQHRGELVETDISLRETVSVRVPLRLAPKEMATVRLALPLAPVQEQLRQMLGLLLLGGGGAVLVAIGFGTLVARRIVRPLERMTGLAERVAAGDFTARASDQSDEDEIGRLATALSTMQAKLKANLSGITTERNQALAIVRNLADGVVALAAGGEVLFANAAAQRLLGGAANLTPGRRLPELGLPTAVNQALTRALGSREPELLEIGDGSRGERVVQVSATPVDDTTGLGPGGGVVVVIRDMTEARRAETMGRELVANASHELRTPLAVIASTADTLLDTTGGDSRQREFLEIITRHAARLQRLVDETLQLSCLQGGIEGRPRELVGLAELVEEALTFHATAAAKKRQQLLVRVSPDLAPVRGVPALLVQAIRNLVDNAIRYAPPGGSVEVRAEAAGTGHVGLLVVDNGPGIAPAEQSRVFDRFYRGATAGEAGTGLGLAIVARVAELHGGRVELESTPGRGCSFRLLLPEAGAGSDAAGPSR